MAVFPQVNEEYFDRSSLQNSSTYQEYVSQLNQINEWKEQNCYSDMSDTVRFQMWQKQQQQQILELHISAEDHEKRKVCIKQCCLQNAIQNKLKLNERQDHVAKIR